MKNAVISTFSKYCKPGFPAQSLKNRVHSFPLLGANPGKQIAAESEETSCPSGFPAKPKHSAAGSVWKGAAAEE